jgi:hypothetical protein
MKKIEGKAHIFLHIKAITWYYLLFIRKLSLFELDLFIGIHLMIYFHLCQVFYEYFIHRVVGL